MSATQTDLQVNQVPDTPSPPFSTYRAANGWIAVSGQLGLVDEQLVSGGVGAETTQALNNLQSVLHNAGASFESVVKVNVYLTSIAHYAEMNRAYEAVFAGRTLPARTAVAVLALPRGAAVEIEAWASAPMQERR